MATRLYLPSSGVAAISPSWDILWASLRDSTAHWPMATTKAQNSALTNLTFTYPNTTTRRVGMGQWVSDQLDVDQTIPSASTFSCVVRGLESVAGADSIAQLVWYVRPPAGGFRGDIITAAMNSEYTTAAQTRIVAATAVGIDMNCLAGDRIVIEIGAEGTTPTSGSTFTQRFGDPSATGDFALTSGLTTDLCPWFELSQNITFGAAPPPADIYPQPIRTVLQAVNRASRY